MRPNILSSQLNFISEPFLKLPHYFVGTKSMHVLKFEASCVSQLNDFVTTNFISSNT